MDIDVECFWCDPLPVADIVLRRYHKNVHDAIVVFDELVLPLDCERAATVHADPKNGDETLIGTDHPSWPKKCSGCDYAFGTEDDYVVYFKRRFQRAGTDEVFGHANPLPVGAMSWTPLRVGVRCGNDVVLATDGAGDGRCLFVVIPRRPDPNRSWHGSVRQTLRWEIDGLSAGADRAPERVGRTWTRSGTPPRITVAQPIDSWLGFSGSLIEGRLRGAVSS